MKPEEKLICDFVYEFTNKHWDNIDNDKCDLSESSLPTEKQAFLNEVLKDVQTAIWVVTELASWGMDKKYLKEIPQELYDDVDFIIWKIGDKYIKLYCKHATDDWEVSFAEQKTKTKTKTVTYFE